MELLLIGNGFDLAHGLPTRYTDFLKYCRDYDDKNSVSSLNELNEEFISFTTDNVWLKYFLGSLSELDNSNTWIDFEKEISEVINGINSIDFGSIKYKDIISNTSLALPSNIKSKNFILTFSSLSKTQELKITVKNIHSIPSLSEFIYVQLRNFTRAFEIYCLYVNEIPIIEPVISSERRTQMDNANKEAKHYSNQLQLARGYLGRERKVAEFQELYNEAIKKYSSFSSGIKPIDYLSISKFDCVLSFNYTNTYERLYGNDKTKYCYIHGKAQNDKNETNMIFGIDDNLQRGEESSNFKWVRFKKYYQRIIYKTGSEYKDWLSSISNQTTSQNYVHIVGHSLDRTDYDVLYEIFDNINFKIIVYYYSSKDFEDKVQKVIKLLAYKGMNGRDELIRRVHGSQWSIKFVNQYDKTEGLFII
ncbi:AbiH family protein [Lacrimispora sp.]|uniref:AbiH family protein n=1 Tax=Lacrimispora sp. TaxID=2719234 RepID=UPI0028AE4EA5|nr:AbiH family protein [Lacrimispora sp.]